MTSTVELEEQTESTGAPEPLAATVRGALVNTGHGWLRRVVVSTKGGCVVLTGRVPSFYLKQTAQTIVLAVPGVEVLRNELEVEDGNDDPR